MTNDPIGKTSFKTSCDVAKTFLAQGGIPYGNAASSAGSIAKVRVGGTVVSSEWAYSRYRKLSGGANPIELRTSIAATALRCAAGW